MKRRVPLLIGALFAAATLAYARVGGGGGYSGGGSDGGGDGDFGIVFGLFRLLLWLVFRHPLIGIPLVIVILIVLSRMAKSGALGRMTVAERPVVYTPVGPSRRGPANLTPVRSTDPLFSEPVFLDFAQLVYARAQEMRGTGSREPLAPWMDAAAIDKLFADRTNLESVSGVIFGATRIVSAATSAGYVNVDVRFEANMTEKRGGHASQILADETWTFRRKAGVRSPAPQRMRVLGCAGCGSTLEPKPDGTCPSCGAPRRGGATQWEVSAIAVASRRPLSAPELGEERGTELPIVYDPRVSAARRTLEGKYPNHDWAAFEARVREAFLALQQAWSTRQWEGARGYESDSLFQAHRFWMERYVAFGLVNHVENVEVSKVVVAKIDADAFYDAITVRIYAAALDWTEDASGRVVGGDKNHRTAFSEYWTFLRAVPGSAAAPTSCPSCAAPLPTTPGATVCAYCGSKLTGDAFEWVASRIEQDDAYSG